MAWYLRYPLSYRDLEEMFQERGFEVDHSTINRWVLAYAPMIEAAAVHCASFGARIVVRSGSTRPTSRSAASGVTCTVPSTSTNPIDFLLNAKRVLDAAKRFLRKMRKDEPLLSPAKIGTDGANTFPSAIKTSVDDGHLHPDPVHYVTKQLQQGIESDHPREEEHAEDRRAPILQNRASNYRMVRNDAVAAKRVWLLRRMDRQ